MPRPRLDVPQAIARTTNSGVGTGNPFSATSPIGSSSSPSRSSIVVDHPVGDQHLSRLGPADDPVGEVDLTAEVIAVAVDSLAAVDSDARLRPLGEAREEVAPPTR